jgi:antirestriction protein
MREERKVMFSVFVADSRGVEDLGTWSIGTWIDFPIEKEEFIELCGNHSMKYLYVADKESDFIPMDWLDERTTYDYLQKIALELQEHCYLEDVSRLLEIDEDIETALRDAENVIYYKAQNEEELGEMVMEESGYLYDIPKGVRNYIDFEDFGRDLLINDDYWEVEGGYICRC